MTDVFAIAHLLLAQATKPASRGFTDYAPLVLLPSFAAVIFGVILMLKRSKRTSA